MAFKVILLPQAEADAREYAEYVATDSAQAAWEWLEGLETEIGALAEMPSRFARIPEQGRFRYDYRHFHYHSHRMVFFIHAAAQTVVVTRIYHGAKDHLRLGDLPR